MRKPRVAILIERPLREALFSDEMLAHIAAVATPVYLAGDERPTPERAQPLLGDAEVALCSWGAPRFDAALLAQAPKLAAVLYGAGSVKRLVSDELIQRGIVVTSGAAAIAEGVAEYALGLLITGLRDTWRLARSEADGGVYGENPLGRVRELYGLSVGVVGCGWVGRAFLRLLGAFPVERLVYDPFLSDAEAEGLGATRVALDELLSRADAVSLHAPNLPATRHMLGAHNLGLLKDGALLINTARGALIDEAALVAELRRGRIFACLDVVGPPKLGPDHPLRRLDNVLITPHIAGGKGNARRRLGRYLLDELDRYVAGRPLQYAVDLGRLDVIA